MNESNESKAKNRDEHDRHYFGKIKRTYKFARQYMEMNTDHPYHNWEHAKDVGHAALRIAKAECVDQEGRFLLLSAALFHDVYYSVGGKKNEERSAELARKVLPGFSYSSSQVERVANLVLATKLPTTPKNLGEMILCDADVDNLGREDCMERGEYLRQELSRSIGEIRKKDWYSMELAFLQKHSYYTASAQAERNPGLRSNISFLENAIDMNQRVV